MVLFIFLLVEDEQSSFLG